MDLKPLKGGGEQSYVRLEVRFRRECANPMVTPPGAGRQRHLRAGAIWVRIASMTWAL
jgi:hypothetical protein